MNATEVTIGLVENNGSIPPGRWLKSQRLADCLYTAIRFSSRPNAQKRVWTTTFFASAILHLLASCTCTCPVNFISTFWCSVNHMLSIILLCVIGVQVL